MVAEVGLSQTTFENLVKHLVEIEEGKDKLLQEFFPKPSIERYEIKTLIENYIEHIDQLIKNANKFQTTDSEVPFVTINSEVELQDLYDHEEVFTYRVISPFRSNIIQGNISCLSPVGKALLLKKVGDVVEVKAPGGLFRFKIKSIRLGSNI